MPVLQPNQLTPEEERHEVIADAILNDAPSIPGFQCVRNITPLVMVALQRSNNPYITGRKGFDAIGIEFDGDGRQLTDAAGFAMAMMPKTAEVLILLSCSREELRCFSRDSAALDNAALDLVEVSTVDALMEATVFVSKQLEALAKSRADQAPEDEKPSAAAIEEGGATGSKKLVRTGSRKS